MRLVDLEQLVARQSPDRHDYEVSFEVEDAVVTLRTALLSMSREPGCDPRVHVLLQSPLLKYARAEG